MSYFRSLLEAAMGDDEMPANIQAFEDSAAAAAQDSGDEAQRPDASETQSRPYYSGVCWP